MASSGSKAINTWDWDIRVRERNLKKGILDEKDVDKYLLALSDVAEEGEGIASPQPALGGREH
jgi:hypothetical protein